MIISGSQSKCMERLQLALKISFRRQHVTLSVLVNEIQDCPTEPTPGSLLSSNGQQLVCTGFIPPQQHVFQLILLQMPDRINRGCVWRSAAQKSWEKSRCGQEHTDTHTRSFFI